MAQADEITRVSPTAHIDRGSHWRGDRYTEFRVLSVCGGMVRVWWIEGARELLLSVRYFDGRTLRPSV